GSGFVQVVARQEDIAHDLRAEFCVLVSGELRRRPAGNENPELPTGDVEVVADRIEILAECDSLPFPVEGTPDVNEEVRLRYRYLDIRRADMSAALRARSTAAYLV